MDRNIGYFRFRFRFWSITNYDICLGIAKLVASLIKHVLPYYLDIFPKIANIKLNK